MLQALTPRLLVRVSTLGKIRLGTMFELPNSIVTIEQCGGLFERAALGLDRENVNVHKLNREPNRVDQVVCTFVSVGRVVVGMGWTHTSTATRPRRSGWCIG
jgi:hypothetical protein